MSSSSSSSQSQWAFLVDRALGSLLGACVGDAAGTIIERIGREPTKDDIQKCWAFTGGGFLSVAPGQVTDDSELAVSLFSALLSFSQPSDHPPSSSPSPLSSSSSSSSSSSAPQTIKTTQFLVALNWTLKEDPIAAIAERYAKWALSNPFDMGITIGGSIGVVRNAVSNPRFFSSEPEGSPSPSPSPSPSLSEGSDECLPPHMRNKGAQIAEAMKKGSLHTLEGRTSQSNGSLMRASPIGIWGWKLTDVEIAWLCRRDSSLSHPHPIVSECVTCYSLALAQLIRVPSRFGAYHRACAYAAEHCSKEVREWLKIAKDTGIFVEFHPRGGWIKIAFIYAFRCLLFGPSFQDSLTAVLSGGGDSDTNACIVGGLIGASFGLSEISPAAVKAVLDCDTNAGRPRPPFLHPNLIPPNIETFLCSPSCLLCCVGPPSAQTSLLPSHTYPSSFPYSEKDFERGDPDDDALFYSQPRFVHHISAPARCSLELYFREELKAGDWVLDLCSSWASHLPFGLGLGVVGVGMNQEELVENSMLASWLVQDLNKNPSLPCTSCLAPHYSLSPCSCSPPSSSSSPPASPVSPPPIKPLEQFDAITLSVSIDYLIKPVEVIRSATSLLKKNGTVYLTISDRMFPSKVVGIWKRLSKEERVGYVANLLHFAGLKNIDGFLVTRELWSKDESHHLVWVVRASKL